jgi:hypothetical protein
MLALYGPLAALGICAGVMRAFAARPGIPAPRKRLLTIGWIVAVLVGAPLWVFLHATMKLGG